MTSLQEQYDLYLEGLANEVMHIMQRHRKNYMRLDLMDKVDVWLVQSETDVLTGALLQFVDAIRERVRIVNFHCNKPWGWTMQPYEFNCSFDHTFTFELYMRKRDDSNRDNK